MAEFSKHGIGMGPEIREEHVEFLMDHGMRGMVISGVMKSTARDVWGSPANSPGTTLRKGLVVSRLAADDKFMEYNNGVGAQGVALGALLDTVNLLDGNGDAQDAAVRIHVGGWYDEDKLHGLDAAGKTDMKTTGALFKEDVLPT